MPFVLGCFDCGRFPTGTLDFGEKCDRCDKPLRAWMLAPDCFTPKAGLVPVTIFGDSAPSAEGSAMLADYEERVKIMDEMEAMLGTLAGVGVPPVVARSFGASPSYFALPDALRELLRSSSTDSAPADSGSPPASGCVHAHSWKWNGETERFDCGACSASVEEVRGADSGSGMTDVGQRSSDYRAGYSTGYADGKAGEAVDDEVAAAVFLNQPVWDIEVPYYDLRDGEDLIFHRVSIVCTDEATAVERAERNLLDAIPSAHILFERTEAKRHV